MTTTFRITVRANEVELRGFVEGEGNVRALADAVKPFGWMVVASIADDQAKPPVTLFHHEWNRNEP
jgi:hypothetical protein